MFSTPFTFLKTASAPLYVGQPYQGGIITYLDGTGQHGLIVSAGNIGTSTWGCPTTGVSTSTSVGSGATNTANILAACGTRPIAASVCDDYSNDGYSDWYLPSKDEMQLVLNAGLITGEGAWWTSSQAGTGVDQTAWQMYNSCCFNGAFKSQSKSIRAMRTF